MNKVLKNTSFHTAQNTIETNRKYIYKEFDSRFNIFCKYIVKISDIEIGKKLHYITMKVDKTLIENTKNTYKAEEFIGVIDVDSNNTVWRLEEIK